MNRGGEQLQKYQYVRTYRLQLLWCHSLIYFYAFLLLGCSCVSSNKYHLYSQNLQAVCRIVCAFGDIYKMIHINKFSVCQP